MTTKKSKDLWLSKKYPQKNQEFCEYENENWIFSPKFAFGLGFERKDSFTLNKTPSLSRIFHGSESLAY